MSESSIPNIRPEDKFFVDRRLISFRHCSYADEVYIPQTLEEHRARCSFVRSRLLLSAGMKPGFALPENPPSISGGKLYHGVIIKNISIETLPGLRLTGSLYLPEKLDGAAPGILCPHGHWTDGRVSNSEAGSVVMRCFQLARLGFVVFSYDMLGYNDNNDLPHEWDSELLQKGAIAGISQFGLQTANSMRAVDFLCSLEEVDHERIGCTGASGGASQTWFIAALDDRIKVTAPVCMLSAHFMGGCPCEEGPLMRITGLSSFDIVSCLAPRPIMLPSVSGDWTTLNPVYEIPALKKVYKLYNAAEQVENFHYEDVHNYNRRTREHVYAFLMRELMHKDCPHTIPEENIAPPPPELLWHNGTKPAAATPESTAAAFSKINDFLSQGNLDFKTDPAAFRTERTALLRELLANPQPETRNVVKRTDYKAIDIPGGKAYLRSFSRRKVGDLIAGVELHPDRVDERKPVNIVIADGSYLDYFDGNCNSAVTEKLMQQGQYAYIIELLGTGSNAWQLKYAMRSTVRLGTAFDEPLFSMRIQDIITVCTCVTECGRADMTLTASGSAVPAALAAAALLDLPVICDMTGVDDSIWLQEVNFQPLIGRLGGIAALLILNAEKGIFSNVPEQYLPYIQI